MFYNIMGRNNEALGFFREAESNYWHSNHMVPCRIYPLSLLMNLKIKIGSNQEAIEIGEKISSMQINDKLLSMKRLHKECLSRLDSLKNVTYAQN